MAEITLKSYTREIDGYIEQSQQLDEAIAHSRYILKTFPKHADTYRLLGKAYLEARRFGDAADLFQRVLSAFPDDFISHVGMAIIREDEGNLDAAIWHMQRASEARPGNSAIEQELKRLIGKQDGLDPQRVRPTRGALARMYFHGELYTYSIAELLAALEEDPDRPDLQVLLARIYWRVDRKSEVAGLCNRVLEKLPYCFEANRITAALLLENGKNKEADIHLHRLEALDPYMAFLEHPMQDPDQVDASAVLLDKLEWVPGQPLPASTQEQPDWALSLGVNLGDENTGDDQEEVPPWLQGDGDLEEASHVHPFAGAKPPPGADIPNWMQDAGWAGSDGAVEEGPEDFTQDDFEMEVEEGELHPADIPSWLNNVQPQPIEAAVEEPAHEPLTPADEAGFMPDWLDEGDGPQAHIPPSEPVVPSQEEPSVGLVAANSEELSPTFDTHDVQPPAELAEELPPLPSAPDTQSELSDEKPAEERLEVPSWLDSSVPGATDTIVSWLGDKSDLARMEEEGEIPAWMRGTGPLDLVESLGTPSDHEEKPTDEAHSPEGTPLPPQEDSPEPVESDLPFDPEEFAQDIEPIDPLVDTGWLWESMERDEEELEAQTEAEEPSPAWLDELDIDMEPAQTPVEEDTTDWVADVTIEELEPESSEMQGETQRPDWLEEVIGDVPTADEGEFLEPEEAAPDWLDSLKQIEPEPMLPPEKPLAQEETASDQADDWLARISEPDSTTTGADDEAREVTDWLSRLEPGEPLDTGLPETSSERDSQMAELPSVEPELEVVSAPVVGADSEEHLQSADEEEAPDWMQDMITPSPVEELPAIEPEFPAEPEAEGFTALPADEFEAVAEPVGESHEELPDEQVPEWLEQITVEPSAEDVQEDAVQAQELEPLTAPEPRPIEKVEPAAEVVPSAEPSLEQPTEEETAPEPDWLERITTSELEGMESTLSEANIPLATEEEPDWLEKIATSELEKPAAEPSEDLQEMPIAEEEPDWLDRESAVEAVVSPGLEKIDQEPAGPDWLELIATSQLQDLSAPQLDRDAPAEESGAPEEIVSAPKWLGQVIQDDAMETIISDSPQAEADPDAAQAAEDLAPDWLIEMGAPELEIEAEADISQEPQEPVHEEAPIMPTSVDWQQQTQEELQDVVTHPESDGEEIAPEMDTTPFAESETDRLEETAAEITPEASEVATPLDETAAEDEPIAMADATAEWLRQMVAGEPDETHAPASQQDEPVADDALPKVEESTADWLTRMSGGIQDEAQEPEPTIDASPVEAEEPSAEETTSDWPTEMASAEPAEAEEPSAPEITSDWLTEMASTEPAEVEEADPAKRDLTAHPEVPGEGESPIDWLSEMAAESELESEPEPGEGELVSQQTVGDEPAQEWVPEFDENAEPEREQSSTRLDAQVEDASVETEEPAELKTPDSLLEPNKDHPIDDDDVFRYLENLAAEQTIHTATPELEEDEEVEKLEEAPLIEEKEFPEDPAESLDWLEQLASENIEDAHEPESQEPEEEADIDVPEWLSVMADEPEPSIEQPPEPDLSALPVISSMETIISKRPPELHDLAGDEIPDADVGFDSARTEGLTTPETVSEPVAESVAAPVEQIEEEILPAEAPVDPLVAAHSALEAGNLKEAIERYGELVSKRSQLERVIQDLRSSLEQNPNVPGLWQVLGDAYMNADQVMQAIEAYRRGVDSV